MKGERALDPRLLTHREVCERLRISPKTLQKLRTARKISYIRFGHRSIRFRPEAVEEFIRRRERALSVAAGFSPESEMAALALKGVHLTAFGRKRA